MGPAWSLMLVLLQVLFTATESLLWLFYLYYSLQVCNLPSSHKSLFCHLKKKKKKTVYPVPLLSNYSAFR